MKTEKEKNIQRRKICFCRGKERKRKRRKIFESGKTFVGRRRIKTLKEEDEKNVWSVEEKLRRKIFGLQRRRKIFGKGNHFLQRI